MAVSLVTEINVNEVSEEKNSDEKIDFASQEISKETEDSISVINVSNLKNETKNNETRASTERTQIDFSDSISVLSTNDVSHKILPENIGTETMYQSIAKNLFKTIIFSVGIILACLLLVVPWTTIPRTNTIVYPSFWWEPCLPFTIYWIVTAGTEFLNLTIWTKEKLLISLNVFTTLSIMYVTPALLSYVISYLIWSVHLGYNHPLPYFGMVNMPLWIVGMTGLWLFLPSVVLAQKEFRRKLKVYTIWSLWCLLLMIPFEVLSYLFVNLSSELQFIFAFVLAAQRELDSWVRTRLVHKMTRDKDEDAMALNTINVSTNYAYYIAIRFVDAELSTVVCVIAIDFVIHLRQAIAIVKDHRKLMAEENEESNIETNINLTNLIVSELVEGFVPVIYGCCIAMAYFGPNAHILVNVGCDFWGQEIKDIDAIFISMLLLFAFDTVSVILTSILLWRMIHVNMMQKFCSALGKCWLYFTVKLGYALMISYFGQDVNVGMDATGEFKWITPEGRLVLIQNSSDITKEEKLELLANKTLI